MVNVYSGIIQTSLASPTSVTIGTQTSTVWQGDSSFQFSNFFPSPAR